MSSIDTPLRNNYGLDISAGGYPGSSWLSWVFPAHQRVVFLEDVSRVLCQYENIY